MRIPKTGVRNDSIVSHSFSAFLHVLLCTKLHFIRMEFTLFMWVLIVWYLYHNQSAELEN